LIEQLAVSAATSFNPLIIFFIFNELEWNLRAESSSFLSSLLDFSVEFLDIHTSQNLFLEVTKHNRKLDAEDPHA